jgi:hypothetical protein
MSFEQEFFETLKLPLSPTTLRRIFLLLLRFHYSDPDNYGDLKPLMGDLIYVDSEGDEGSLDIELLSIFDPRKRDPGPGIFVGFQPFTFKKPGVNYDAGTNNDGSAQYAVMTVDAQLIIKHISTLMDSTTIMGEATTAFLFGIRPMLMQRLCLRGFDIVSMTDAKQIEKAPDRTFECNVVININFDYVMTTNVESHRIKKVAAALNPGP